MNIRQVKRVIADIENQVTRCETERKLAFFSRDMISCAMWTSKQEAYEFATKKLTNMLRGEAYDADMS